MSEERTVLTPEQKQQMMSGMIGQPPKTETDEKETLQEGKRDEKVADRPSVETETKQPTEKTASDTFDFSIFKTKFEREISDEESLKTLFDKSDKYDELDKTYKEALQTLDEYKTIASKVNPLSHFANENEYKRQQLLIKYGGELSVDAMKELSVLNPNEVKSLSDVDALKLQLMIENGLSSKEATSYLSRKYGVDDFSDEAVEDDVRVALKVDAQSARRGVSKLYDGIEVPTATDVETARTQLKEVWNKEVPNLVNKIDKIDLGDGLDFVVTDDIKKDVQETVLSWAMANGLQPSKETNERITGMAEDLILIANKDKIVKSIKADLQEQIKADVRKTVHNDKPLDDTTRASDTATDNDSKMKRMI